MSAPLATLGLCAALLCGLCALLLGASAAFAACPHFAPLAGAGTAGLRQRRSVQLYLIALFLLLFDFEAAYVFGLAVSTRGAGAGWATQAAMLAFLALLGITLLWQWQRGAPACARAPRCLRRPKRLRVAAQP